MSAQIIDGRVVAAEIRAEIKDQVHELNQHADFSHQYATLNYEPEGYTHWFD